MKWLAKVLILCLLFPYLVVSSYAFTVWYETPPIVSQEIQVRVVNREPILGEPNNTNLVQLCDGAWRDFKSYMNWEAITDHSSQQYKFISEFMFVDGEDGLLRLKTDTRFIGVALGSYFGEIGSKFKFTLEGGNILYAVKVEAKADKHVYNGCVHKGDSSIIEFVINEHFKDYYKVAADAGSLHVIPEFSGAIQEIEKVN